MYLHIPGATGEASSDNQFADPNGLISATGIRSWQKSWQNQMAVGSVKIQFSFKHVWWYHTIHIVSYIWYQTDIIYNMGGFNHITAEGINKPWTVIRSKQKFMFPNPASPLKQLTFTAWKRPCPLSHVKAVLNRVSHYLEAWVTGKAHFWPWL